LLGSQLLSVGLFIVLLLRALESLIDVLNLFVQQEHLGFSLPDLHGIYRVLLVQLNESLLKLDDLLIDYLDFLLNILLLKGILGSRFALALALNNLLIFFVHDSLGFGLIVLLEF